MNCENDGTDGLMAQGAAHGRRDVSDVDRVPGGPVGLAGGSGGQPGRPGGPGGQPGNPRAARVLVAVGDFMARQKASPGRAKRRGRRGGRGVKTALTAPESAPLFKEPAFSAPSAGCSSPCTTTARIGGAK